MQDLVTASMQQGAAGVSTGLIYPPNAFATLDELVALSTPAAALGGRYASHLRHDGKKLRDGIGEAIAIGERAKIPVHVFHIKVTGQANFGRMKEVVALVEAARARGVTAHRRHLPLRGQQHQPHRDAAAVGDGRRPRQDGRAARRSRAPARACAATWKTRTPSGTTATSRPARGPTCSWPRSAARAVSPRPTSRPTASTRACGWPRPRRPPARTRSTSSSICWSRRAAASAASTSSCRKTT